MSLKWLYCPKPQNPIILCLYINLPYAHVWNAVVTSGLVSIRRTIGPSLAASLEPLARHLKCGQLRSFLLVLLW